MKFLFYFFFIFVFFNTTLFSQVPEIQWQKCYGGSSMEQLEINSQAYQSSAKLLTRDKKNIIIGGKTISNDGDIGFIPGFDSNLWVAKLDLTGNLIWKHTIDGLGEETFSSVIETSGGDVLVIGFSQMDPGVDPDAIIIKIDRNGSILWKKYFGGTMTDYAHRIIETADGNYVFVGDSYSDDGHLAGNSATDRIWIAKIESNGDLLWSKKMPGAPYFNFSLGLLEDHHNNLLVGINLDSFSNVGFRIMKLQNNGNLIWTRNFDGPGREDILNDIKQLSLNEFIIAGYTESDGGDFINQIGRHDGFLMSIDSMGNKSWVRRYGGTEKDFIQDLTILPDLSFLIAGFTRSVDGDLSTDPARNWDGWIANISAQGNVVWSKTLGGSSAEYGTSVSAVSDNEFLFFAEMHSNDFDVSGSNGFSDFWIVKLGNTSKISGTAFYDSNLNGIKDVGEIFADGVDISFQKGAYDRSAITQGGLFEINVDTGTYNISASYPYYNIIPTSSTANFTSYFQTQTIDFALQPIPGINDIQISLIPLGPARPGFPVSYKIIYKNLGTTVINNPVIKFIKNNNLTVSNTIPGYSSIVADTLIWNLGPLNLYDTGSIHLSLVVAPPPTVVNGFLLKTHALIDPGVIDATPVDDTSYLTQIVIGSIDPNDKTEANAGKITPAQVTNGEYLNYLIRFQNTGTDTAFNVIVRDTLDTKLDWNTFQMISSSHGYQLTINGNDKLTWNFTGINLPDSNVNEIASHGYIAYRIKPKNTVILGDVINNTAGIYFDFNLPVATNIQTTTVFQAAALPVTITSLDASIESDNKVLVQWKTSDEQNVESYEVQKSADGINFAFLGKVPSKTGTRNIYSLTDATPSTGITYYRLKSIDKDGKYSLSKIVSVNLSGNNSLAVSVYPNPAQGQFVIKLSGQTSSELQILINDMQGRKILEKKYTGLSVGTVTIPLDFKTIGNGVYLLQIKTGQHTSTQKLIIR